MAIGALLGAGKEAEAYAYGPHVLKLYRRPEQRSVAFAEAAVLAIVADHGLPSPAVHEAGRYDSRWGLVMDRAEGSSLGSQLLADPGLAPEALAAMVQLQRAVHARGEPRLPPLKRRLASRIARAPGIEAHRQALLDTLAALPDGDRICHGDFHPFNLIGAPGALTIVDWPDATSGPPAADACRTWLLLHPHQPDFAAAYLATYVAASGLAEPEIMSWRPVLAAARLCENVPEEEPLLRRLAAGELP
jgi:aminoglycoside phosphotransferase (APT) family kinase protein